MNQLLNALRQETNVAYTANGAVTNESTLDANLDFFNIGPVCKASPKDAVDAFVKAYATNREIALRTLQWVRDVRGGAGARQAFRDCFAWLMNRDANDAIAILNKTALIGRWDDVLVGLFSEKPSVQAHTVELLRNALFVEQNGLCAKWMPRKGDIAVALTKTFKLTPKGYRKLIVSLSKTVEQQMCAKDWEEINYSHVPSVAFSRYRKAFKRNDETRYTAFTEAAVKGEVKVNASAIFPHDVVKGLNGYGFRGGVAERNAINAQWKSLPNYMEGDDTGIVVADVSGSMGFPVAGESTALDVCIALAMYMAERARGAFKDTFITFSSQPKLQTIVGDDIVDRYRQLSTAQWSMSTDLQAVFSLILNTATKNHVAQADMPKLITILSDMEFNQCITGGTNLDGIRSAYKLAGYEMPKVVFWNLNGRAGNAAAKATDRDVGLISGYSPAILGSIFGVDDFTPVAIMLKTVMNERYDLELQ